MSTAIASSIIVMYVVALASWLRHEKVRGLLALGVAVVAAIFFRLVYPNTHPWSIEPDQPRELMCAIEASRDRWGFLRQGCIGIPVFFSVLFKAQFISIIGSWRWAFNAYSMLCGVLSVPVAFSLARTLGMRLAPSLLGAFLVAVLPWSVYYGRVDIGGELVLHTLLLATALARIVSQQGRALDVLIGASGLALLQYDYHAGRAMLALPLVAMVAAPRAQLPRCMALLLLGVTLWVPQLYVSNMGPFGNPLLHPNDVQNMGIVAALLDKIPKTLHTFVAPTCWNGPALSHPAIAMHPTGILLLVLLGCLVPQRRTLLLLGAAGVGLAPALLSSGPFPSSHRMLLGMPFLSLLAASGLDAFAARRAASLVCVLVPYAAGWSFLHYFSETAWPAEIRNKDLAVTTLIDSLPGPDVDRISLSKWTGEYQQAASVSDARVGSLDLDNWIPATGEATSQGYVNAAPMRPFFASLLGSEHVEDLPGGSYFVHYDSGDWNWLRQHGWTVRFVCDGKRRTAHAPTLFHEHQGMSNIMCAGPVRYEWLGRWNGMTTRLRFAYQGSMGRVQSGDFFQADTDGDRVIEFTAHGGTQLRISIDLFEPRQPLVASLLVADDPEPRLPAWRDVSPMGESTKPSADQ